MKMNMENLHQSKTSYESTDTLADTLFQERKKSLPRYTERDLVEIFSPPAEMIRKNLEKYTEEYRRKRDHIKEALQRVYMTATDDFYRWFGETVIKIFLLPDLEKYTRHMARLKRLLNILNPQNLRGITPQEALEKARQYPIFEIAKYRLALQPCRGNKSSSLCPFHEEKHASFYIYHETNTFYCFGCQESGDVIKLTMHLYGVSFKEAIQMLQ
jgi:DNA primase